MACELVSVPIATAVHHTAIEEGFQLALHLSSIKN